jgi:dihydroflavonol-4-reductase
MKILVTGASGFIGSFIVEEALNRGMEVWAAVRSSSSRAYLQDPRIHFVELNLGSQKQMAEQLHDISFDYVVHAAGATKCIHSYDFFRINTQGTINLVNALRQLRMPIRRFVYLSSLSVCGPLHEQQPYKDLVDSDTPRPDTIYGLSKLESEAFLDKIKAEDDAAKSGASSDRVPFPFVILRPTGVYGPREHDYFMMAQSIKRHTDFAVGYKRQDLTFIYVKDVVQAVFLALDHGKAGRKYFISDGNVYLSRAFSDLIRKELGNPWLIRIKAPVWVLRVVTWIGEYLGRATGKVTALNNDKYNIMKQRNWRCDIKPAIDELGFKPEYDLDKGVKLTIRWYKDNGWL